MAKKKTKSDFVAFNVQTELTVLTDGRIKLPCRNRRHLSKSNIDQICVGRIPGKPAVALVPEPFWERWEDDLRDQYPDLKKHTAVAAYFTPLDIKNPSNKFKLPSDVTQKANLLPGKTAKLIPYDYYFELWELGKLNEALS